MNTNSLPRRSVALLSGLLGILGLLGSVPVTAQVDVGDLTVTVEELAGGQVRITVSGSTDSQDFIPSLSNTNYAFSPTVPPANGTFGQFPLPPGLFLTIPTPPQSEPEEGGTSGTIDLPLDSIDFPKGNWFLRSSSSSSVGSDGEISGSGSIVTGAVPFSYFVPGTFYVGPPMERSGAEAAEPEDFTPGQDGYYITYVVIPYDRGPSIRISNPGRFPTTRVGRSGGSRKVLVRNTGDFRLTQVSASLTGHTRDFSHTLLPKTTLEPGESTMLSVRFRPTRKGTRRAILTARGTAAFDFVSEPEAAAEEISAPAPMIVSDSVELVGRGVLQKKPKRKPRPKVNTPRFPRFFGQLN